MNLDVPGFFSVVGVSKKIFQKRTLLWDLLSRNTGEITILMKSRSSGGSVAKRGFVNYILSSQRKKGNKNLHF